jgi:hypothetical protein
MGERFLVLEETAAGLDGIDPELGNRFRITNGLPLAGGSQVAGGGSSLESTPSSMSSKGHEIRMVVGDDDVRAECTCGQLSSEVDWDGIDTMVIRIREHLGSDDDATSVDGIPTRAPSRMPERRVG